MLNSCPIDGASSHTHSNSLRGGHREGWGGGGKMVGFSPFSSILVRNYNLRNIFRALYLIEEEKGPT